MPYKIFDTNQQSKSLIANGEIEEYKSIGISPDNKSIKPYSNIFLLSRIWTDMGGEIPDHNHKGFEILTYVLTGSIEHLNPNTKTWTKIGPGDFELLKAGNGINQTARISSNCEALQIWFDPDLRSSLIQPYEWHNIQSNDCYQIESPGKTIKILIDDETKVKLNSEDIKISEYKITPGTLTLKLRENKYYTIYVIKGELEVEGKFITEHSLLIIRDESKFRFDIAMLTRFLIIETPIRPKYKTYLQLKSDSNS